MSIVAHYIKERTKDAQFIIISLRNNMFELADRLVRPPALPAPGLQSRLLPVPALVWSICRTRLPASNVVACRCGSIAVVHVARQPSTPCAITR